ncbi:RimK family alpha-L-glutamate ligase [Streptomyces sp. NPDC020917]|uniref:RimK family alpha-L-glutamate ligase n=1 Tax=Streptomyces sp. NPDC020917 TaxID=3365102 RepID=UPI00378B283D
MRPRPVPAVLLLSRTCDTDLDPVARRLAEDGVPCVRLNADETRGADLCAEPDGRCVRVNGRLLAPTVAWIRHFDPPAVPPAVPDAPDAAAAATAFLRESWLAACDDLAAVSGTAIRAHRPGTLAQLRLARRHGVAVPRTVLTTDPHGVLDRFDSPRLVVKAAHRHFVETAPGRLTGVFPVITDRDELAAGPRPGPPVLVQEHIAHEAELRVYYAAGRIVAFRVTKGAPDEPWTAPGRIGAELVEPPPPVAAATTRLAAAMSLRFGAFDFLMRAGEPVFLEVNPDGDWHWAERRAGTTAVTEAVAAMLATLHRASPPVPADLLTLLAWRPA